MVGPILRMGCVVSALLLGQAASAQTPSEPAADDGLLVITVTAEKRTESQQDAQMAVSVAPLEEMGSGLASSVKDAGRRVPNLNILEFTARAISAPRMRGIGGSLDNPGVTTLIDGVPQLTANTASQVLYDVQQIEFA